MRRDSYGGSPELQKCGGFHSFHTFFFFLPFRICLGIGTTLGFILFDLDCVVTMLIF
jgi:hypothetical protein